MIINLTPDGVFPIIYDKNGVLINEITDTGYQIPGTLQGEGVFSGIPSIFIRTTGCNLRCAWETPGGGSPCDTPYSSFDREIFKAEIDDVVSIVQQNTVSVNIKHIVITGGEPTIQTNALVELITKLKKHQYMITLETNGTLYNDFVAQNVDLISLSPKLKSSVPLESHLINTPYKFNKNIAIAHDKKRININVLQQYIDNSINYQLKFVISSYDYETDINEIQTILHKLNNIKTENVLIMPEGLMVSKSTAHYNKVVQYAIQHGYRFCPRIHTFLYGNKKNV